jgi:hypothetical protein
MHLPINVESPNNISKWQVGFNSAFKGLISNYCICVSDPVGCGHASPRDMEPMDEAYELFLSLP